MQHSVRLPSLDSVNRLRVFSPEHTGSAQSGWGLSRIFPLWGVWRSWTYETRTALTLGTIVLRPPAPLPNLNTRGPTSYDSQTVVSSCSTGRTTTILSRLLPSSVWPSVNAVLCSSRNSEAPLCWSRVPHDLLPHLPALHGRAATHLLALSRGVFSSDSAAQRYPRRHNGGSSP